MAGAAVRVIFAAEAHSAAAIQRAAYKFSDRFALELQRDGDNQVCVLHPSGDSGLDDETVNAFRTEVLDQVLRERIRDETAGVRNVILALAFSKVNGEIASDQLIESDANATPTVADEVTGMQH
jgi:His-Xaa-Ser system protein HxsD